MKQIYIFGIALLLILTESSADNKQVYEQALKSIASGNLSVEAINDTPISGMKELTVNTGNRQEIIYISTDGDYIFNGSLFDIKNRIDVTENKKAELRNIRLKQFNLAQRVNYFPENMQYTVTVFTDLDCPYCRQLHQQLADYHDLGIGISYLFFPRSGLDTPSSQKAVSAWCADDRKKALDKALNGAELPQLQCDNPVAEHYNAGIAVGVTGTPALVLEDGTMIPGLVSPQQLKQRLDRINNSQ